MNQRLELSEQTRRLEPEERYGKEWEAIRAGKLPKEKYIEERKAEDEEKKKREAELAELARIDPLTGLDNRRVFDEEIEIAIAAVRRTGQPLSLLFMDMDALKKINDALGHPAGDEALKQIAVTLRAQLPRTTDRIFRLGAHSDELVVILPATDQTGAFEVSERLRQAVEGTDIVYQNPQDEQESHTRATISIGVSTSTLSAPLGREAMVKQADAALLFAKQSGRNRIGYMKNEGAFAIWQPGPPTSAHT